MFLFVSALHVVVCLLLVAIILLQPGKGADAASAFGGGMTSTVFGPRGPTNVLQQATTFIAVMFMVTSITLSLYSKQSTTTGDDSFEQLRREQLEQQGGGAPANPASPAADAPISAPPEGSP